MSDESTGQPPQRHFLTVEEAARMMGVSRMRIREAVACGLLEAQRDNEGRLRVDAPEDGLPQMDTRPAPEKIVETLFDEIDELYDTLAARNETIEAMADLLERQDAGLARTLALLEAREADAARLSDLLDRALTSAERLAHAETEDAAAPLLARALDAADRMEAQLVAKEAQLAEREAALERVLSLAERGLSALDTAPKATLWQRLTGSRRTPTD